MVDAGQRATRLSHRARKPPVPRRPDHHHLALREPPDLRRHRRPSPGPSDRKHPIPAWTQLTQPLPHPGRPTPQPVLTRTVVKKVDFGRNDLSQPFLATQPKLHRRRPNSTGRRLRTPESHPGDTERFTAKASTKLNAWTSPDRRGSASTLPLPMPLYKSRFKLPQDCTPLRPHVLRSLPHGYTESNMPPMTVRHPEVKMTSITLQRGKGATAAVVSGCNPLARNALGTAL